MVAMLRFLRLALTLTPVVALGACDTTVMNHGHRLADEDLGQIRPGVTSRGEVMALLGTPSTQGSFDEDTWYYVGRRVEERTFYNRSLTAQDVVRVRFDDTGTVSAVERFDIADGRTVRPSDDSTPTGGNELNVFQQFVGNIGRFNAPTGTAPLDR